MVSRRWPRMAVAGSFILRQATMSDGPFCSHSVGESPSAGYATCDLDQDQLAMLIRLRESLETEKFRKQNPEPPAKNWDSLFAVFLGAFDSIIAEESRRDFKRLERRLAAEHAKGACFEAYKNVSPDCANIAGYTRKVIQNELKNLRLGREVWNMSPAAALKQLRAKQDFRFANIRPIGAQGFSEEVIGEEVRLVERSHKRRSAPRKDKLDVEDLLALFPDSEIDQRIIYLCAGYQIEGEPESRCNWLIANDLRMEGFKISADTVRRCRNRIGETIERRFPDRFRRTERYKRQTAKEEAEENPAILLPELASAGTQ